MKALFGYNFGRASIAIIPDSQKKASKEDWTQVDFATLPSEAQVAFKAFQDYNEELKATEAFKRVQAARTEYEMIMRSVLGIKSDKLSKQSFADYLASRTEAGYAA
jgi:hypothetical protein